MSWMPSNAELEEISDSEIKNVNSGVSEHKIQINEPPFFVSWQQNGKSKIEYFKHSFEMERIKALLQSQQGYNINKQRIKANTLTLGTLTSPNILIVSVKN